MKTFGLLVVILICSELVISSPVEANHDDDDYLQDKSETDDYEDDDFDEPDDKRKGPTSSSSPEPEEPYKTNSYTEKADAGKTVTLKCLDESKAASRVVMWYNETVMLAQGEALVSKDSRITFNKDLTLTIKNVSSDDSGEFRCRSFPERHETKIQLYINGPPRGITIGHNINSQSNVADATLTYKAGEKDLRFKCNVAKGRPQPKLNWIHNGNTILDSQQKDHDIKIDNEGVLIIRSVHARNAGEYQCEASNEFGNIKASFKIQVEYLPFFMHHSSYFNAEEGLDAEIHCLYKSFPAPTSVKWLKGGSYIHNNHKYSINNDMKEHHDRTKLLIKNVDKKDLTLYQCEVVNDLGSKRENVTLGVGPAPAKFDGYKYINNIVYTDWIIKSRQQLAELQILYRNNEFGWRPKTAQITNRNEIGEGEWKVQGSIELEVGDWIIMARAKNTEGWSDDRFSKEVVIKIPKDSIETQNQTSGASHISQAFVGLLVTLLAYSMA